MAKKPLTDIEKKIIHTPLPEIKHAYQKSVSFSQYSTFMKCNHKWYLHYGLGNYEDKPSINMTFGTAMHETLQHYLKIMYEESGTTADKEDLHQIFETSFQKTYQEDYTKYKQHFSDAQEMGEFFDDGKKILDYFKKHRNEYFTTRNCRLLGIELPLIYEVEKNLFIKAYLDIVLYDIDLDKVYIIDFKTSTRGWGDKEKKDNIKTSQIVLYKDYFAKQYGFDVDKVEVEYVILKRKIWEQSEYPQSHLQSFRPANGKTTRNKVNKNFKQFLETCFDENGKYKLEQEFEKNLDACKWCPYNDNGLCQK